MSDQVLDIEEVASLLNNSVSEVDEFAKIKSLPSFILEDGFHFLRADVQNFASKRAGK